MKITILKKNKDILREVSAEEVISSVDNPSKKLKKKIFNVIKQYWEEKNYQEPPEDKVEDALKMMAAHLEAARKSDIPERNKGTALRWLKDWLLQKENIGFIVLTADGLRTLPRGHIAVVGGVIHLLEKFFLYQEFIPDEYSKDVFDYSTFDALSKPTRKAVRRFQEKQEEKEYLDAEKGSNKIYEDDKWVVYIPENKGAACKLGKGTEWCTAAPGLDYFDHYAEQGKMYIFINKQNPEEKYQFQYETEQFMDRNDVPVETAIFKELSSILVDNNLLDKKQLNIVQKKLVTFDIEKLIQDLDNLKVESVVTDLEKKVSVIELLIEVAIELPNSVAEFVIHKNESIKDILRKYGYYTRFSKYLDYLSMRKVSFFKIYTGKIDGQQDVWKFEDIKTGKYKNYYLQLDDRINQEKEEIEKEIIKLAIKNNKSKIFLSDLDEGKNETMKPLLETWNRYLQNINENKEVLNEAYYTKGVCEDTKELIELELFHEDFDDNTIEEAEYQGRKVKLNKPMRGDVKKFKVYVKDPKTGNVKKVNFGDPNMRIKKSNPKRRKSFRARHNCDNPGPKTKARYWSCRAW